MQAFFSGTDDANENNNQFYAVWGQVDKDIPQIAFRYVVGDNKVNCSPDVLFDWPKVNETIVTTTKIHTQVTGDLELLDGYEETNVINDEPEVLTETNLVEGPFKQIEYPEDWMDQHEKEVYTPYNYGSYGKKKKGGAKNRSGKSTTGSNDYYDDYYDYYDDYYDYYYGGGYGYGTGYSGYEQMSLYDEQQEEDANYDELKNLELYPEKKESSLASPELVRSVRKYLEKIRKHYPDVYDSFMI